MGKIDKLLDRTIDDKGDFWRIVVVLVAVATLIVTLAGFGLQACSDKMASVVWSTDGTTTEASQDAGQEGA